MTKYDWLDDFFPRTALDDWFNVSLSTQRASKAHFVQKNGDYCVELDMPGVKKENVSATLEKDTLILEWKRGNDAKRATYKLPIEVKNVDWSKPRARLSDGVLTLCFPIIASMKPTAIPIEIED